MIYIFGHNYPSTDLDSIVSSIALEALLRRRGEEAQAVLVNPSAMNQETQALLALTRLHEPPLISASDLVRGDLALVDHNDPHESYGHVGITKKPRIIVDHHLDTNQSASLKVLDQVGATATLVAEMAEKERVDFGPILSQALAYTILVDTLGLKSQKTTERDVAAAKRLLEAAGSPASLEILWGEILSVRQKARLSGNEVARASLKEYADRRIGIANLVVTDDEYLKVLNEAMALAAKFRYQVYGLMVVRQHTGDTEFFWHDQMGLDLPFKGRVQGLLSRAQNVAPALLTALAQADAQSKGIRTKFGRDFKTLLDSLSDEELMAKATRAGFPVAERTPAHVLREFTKAHPDFANTAIALPLCMEAHDGQTRGHRRPYAEHPISVALMLLALGQERDGILAAALLHDVVEDGRATEKDLLDAGIDAAVLSSVRRLTKTQPLDLTRYYRDMEEDADALLVKLADRAHNLSEMALGFSVGKIKRYVAETREHILPLAQYGLTRFPKQYATIWTLKNTIEGTCDLVERLTK